MCSGEDFKTLKLCLSGLVCFRSSDCVEHPVVNDKADHCTRRCRNSTNKSCLNEEAVNNKQRFVFVIQVKSALIVTMYFLKYPIGLL